MKEHAGNSISHDLVRFAKNEFKKMYYSCMQIYTTLTGCLLCRKLFPVRLHVHLVSKLRRLRQFAKDNVPDEFSDVELRWSSEVHVVNSLVELLRLCEDARAMDDELRADVDAVLLVQRGIEEAMFRLQGGGGVGRRP